MSIRSSEIDYIIFVYFSSRSCKWVIAPPLRCAIISRFLLTMKKKKKIKAGKLIKQSMIYSSNRNLLAEVPMVEQFVLWVCISNLFLVISCLHSYCLN
jgi:hypothetical protein